MHTLKNKDDGQHRTYTWIGDDFEAILGVLEADDSYMLSSIFQDYHEV